MLYYADKCLTVKKTCNSVSSTEKRQFHKFCVFGIDIHLKLQANKFKNKKATDHENGQAAFDARTFFCG